MKKNEAITAILEACGKAVIEGLGNVPDNIEIGKVMIDLKIRWEPIEETANIDREITEEDLDRECNKHYDCCDCPYDDYCSEGEDDDE